MTRHESAGPIREVAHVTKVALNITIGAIAIREVWQQPGIGDSIMKYAREKAELLPYPVQEFLYERVVPAAAWVGSTLRRYTQPLRERLLGEPEAEPVRERRRKDMLIDEDKVLPEMGRAFGEERVEPGPDDFIHFSPDVPLYDPKDIEDLLGFPAYVPAIIRAGDQRIMVVDVRNYERDDKGYRLIASESGDLLVDADFLLVNVMQQDSDRTKPHFIELKEHQNLLFGRANADVVNSFDTSHNKISRAHFRIDYDKHSGITISDLNSKHGTHVTKANHSVFSNRTVVLRNRLSDDPRYSEPVEGAPYGLFLGRPILGHKSDTIAGGIYLGGSSREAIAVPEDDARIARVYQELLDTHYYRPSRRGEPELKQPVDQFDTAMQLEHVKKIVMKHMAYDGAKVQDFGYKYLGDREVSLGDYIDRRIGVCRHQGLLAAYLLERLVQDGFLDGTVAIQRNTIPEYGGTHAWAGFIDNKPNRTGMVGIEHVVNPAQDFSGTKAQARQQPGKWDYYLALN